MTAWLRSRLLILAGLVLAAAATPAHAASCNVTAQSVNFGAYDPFAAAALDGVGNIGIVCDAEVTVTIALSPGSGTYGGRSLTGGSAQLTYNLFTSAQRLVVWGDGSGGTDTVSATVQNADIPVYGTIEARQNVPAGTYTDTIVVTVTY